MADTLRVRARGTALVQNYEAMDAGSKRFIGRRYQQVDGDVWGFAPSGEAQDVPDHIDYRRPVAEGALWPADEATAAKCGVKFDPTFGGTVPASPDANASKKGGA